MKALLPSILRQVEEIFYVPMKLQVKHFILHYLKDVLEKEEMSLMRCRHTVIGAILSCHEQLPSETPPFFDQWSHMGVSTATLETPECLASENIKRRA